MLFQNIDLSARRVYMYANGDDDFLEHEVSRNEIENSNGDMRKFILFLCIGATKRPCINIYGEDLSKGT